MMKNMYVYIHIHTCLKHVVPNSSSTGHRKQHKTLKLVVITINQAFSDFTSNEQKPTLCVFPNVAWEIDDKQSERMEYLQSSNPQGKEN